MMNLTLGYRVGLLLAQYGKPIGWNQAQLGMKLKALKDPGLTNLTPSAITNTLSAKGSDKLKDASKPKEVISVIAEFFGEPQYLKERRTTVEVLKKKLDTGTTSDRAFMIYLTESGRDSSEIEFDLVGASRDALQGKLRDAYPQLMGLGMHERRRPQLPEGKDAQELFFLYRLGFGDQLSNSRLVPRKDGLKLKADTLGMVLRRVPARFILRQSAPYRLEYEEHYVNESGIALPAHAYVYTFQNFLTVFSKDKSQAGAGTRPALMHLDWRRAQNNDDGMMPGVVAMESDCYTQPTDVEPTAYRLLFRRCPWEQEVQKIATAARNAAQQAASRGRRAAPQPEAESEDESEKAWSLFKFLSETIELKDVNKNGIIDLGDGKDWGEEENFYGDGDTPWAAYFKRLNVIRCPIDVQVARYSTFNAKFAKARWVGS